MGWVRSWTTNWVKPWTTGFVVTTEGLPSIPGLTAWYDFTNATYLTLSSTAITQALDRSGNGNHTDVQGTATARATFTANQINGLSASVFDGGDFLVLPSTMYSIANSNNTLFVVARTSLDTTQQRVIAGAEAASSRYLLEFSSSSGQVIFLNNTSTAGGVAATGITKSNANIYTCFLNGTTQSISVNGGAATTNTSGNYENGIDAMRIGSGATGGAFLTGVLAEIIIYNRALSSSEITQVSRYLSKKFNITIT